jgi:sugar O-acyltransferase (sialic acid O-acetyltransferase NeuD family)
MILIIGAGGHGQVVADIFRARNASRLVSDQVGFVDDDRARLGCRFVGSPVLGTLARIPEIPHDAVIVAVGDNATRSRVFLKCVEAGERLAIAEHPRCIVAEDAAIGPGSMLCAGAIVNTGAVIGRNVIVNTGATVDHHSIVGDHVHIAPGVHMGGEVVVDEGALVGIGAVVLPRVRIGAWSTVGAGAVVTADVPPGATVVGVPARVLPVAATV